MKNKTLMGLIATATIGTTLATPVIMNNKNTTPFVNKVLMVNNTNSSLTNEAVVINGNSNMNLYALSNGTGIVSKLSIGEMLTILGQAQNGYCKVRVQETGAIGYINVVNMQNILNGTNDTFTQLSGNGQVVNVSSNVRLRSNPSIGNNIIGHLTNGTNLNILGKQGQWYKVSVNGQIGFIYEEYVNINTTNSNNQSINTNSGNTNISTINSSNSNFISNTNSNNHMKNTIVRTKRSETSNSLSNINNSKNSGIKSNTSGSYLATVNKICYIVPKPGMILSQAEMNSPKYTNSKLSNGTQVLVSKKTSNLPSGWVKITVQDGVTGYLPISDINTTNTSNEKNKIGSNIQHASGLDVHVNNMSNRLIRSQNTDSKNSNNLQVQAKEYYNNRIINNSSSLIGKIVYPIPGKLSNIYKDDNTKSSIVKYIGNTNTKMKVLGVISNDNGYNGGDKTWYKVELVNGKIGYVPQSFTYYKIIYTNPNDNIPICLGPDEADQDSTVIKHKKVPMYVSYELSNVKNGGSVIPATFYKVTLQNGFTGFVSI